MVISSLAAAATFLLASFAAGEEPADAKARIGSAPLVRGGLVPEAQRVLGRKSDKRDPFDDKDPDKSGKAEKRGSDDDDGPSFLLLADVLAANLFILGEQIDEAIDAGIDGLFVDVTNKTASLALGVVKALRENGANAPMMANIRSVFDNGTIEELFNAGVNTFVVPAEESQRGEGMGESVRSVLERGAQIGVAFSTIDSLHEVLQDKDAIDFCLFTKEKSGRFSMKDISANPTILGTLREAQAFLEEQGFPCTLIMQGDVDEETAEEMARNGARALILGNHCGPPCTTQVNIFDAKDTIKEKIDTYRNHMVGGFLGSCSSSEGNHCGDSDDCCNPLCCYDFDTVGAGRDKECIEGSQTYGSDMCTCLYDGSKCTTNSHCCPTDNRVGGTHRPLCCLNPTGGDKEGFCTKGQRDGDNDGQCLCVFEGEPCSTNQICCGEDTNDGVSLCCHDGRCARGPRDPNGDDGQCVCVSEGGRCETNHDCCGANTNDGVVLCCESAQCTQGDRNLSNNQCFCYGGDNCSTNEECGEDLCCIKGFGSGKCVQGSRSNDGECLCVFEGMPCITNQICCGSDKTPDGDDLCCNKDQCAPGPRDSKGGDGQCLCVFEGMSCDTNEMCCGNDQTPDGVSLCCSNDNTCTGGDRHPSNGQCCNHAGGSCSTNDNCCEESLCCGDGQCTEGDRHPSNGQCCGERNPSTSECCNYEGDECSSNVDCCGDGLCCNRNFFGQNQCEVGERGETFCA
ncbi:hypothetical protein ACHAWF_007815 [Thalassiosira exigua]